MEVIKKKKVVKKVVKKKKKSSSNASSSAEKAANPENIGAKVPNKDVVPPETSKSEDVKNTDLDIPKPSEEVSPAIPEGTAPPDEGEDAGLFQCLIKKRKCV